jgi:hypothetical protein
VQDQRFGVRGEVGPDRPGVAGRDRAHPEKIIDGRAWVGAGHPRPRGAVPVRQQRALDAGFPVPPPGRPGVATRVRADGEQVVLGRAWVQAGHSRPGGAIPVQDQRVGGCAGGVVLVVADRPGVAA